MKLLCDIFRSPRDSDMYLYVKKEDGLEHLPEPLLARFGKPIHCMSLVLTPERKLARADITKVLSMLEEQGYYLQLPATKDPEMLSIHQRNDKIHGNK